MQQQEHTEPTAEQQKRRSRRRLFRRFWAALAGVLGIALLGCVLWAFSQIRSTENRVYVSSPLPWAGEGVVVERLNGWWKSGKGDDRMALRSTLYPIANVKLGDCKGSGLLVLSFHDEFGRQVGDPVHLPYREGQFNKQEAAWIRAEGDNATCRIEVGFDNEDGLLLQQLLTETPLWTVRLRYRTNEERTLHHLGTISIEPREQKTAE
ncbi:MAG: hypothetical protein MJ051_04760 [Akkermansia sp.]|nr:hypothetical protein [Akkermansia sp.]